MTGQSLMVHKDNWRGVYFMNERLLTNYLNNLDIYKQKRNEILQSDNSLHDFQIFTQCLMVKIQL